MLRLSAWVVQTRASCRLAAGQQKGVAILMDRAVHQEVRRRAHALAAQPEDHLAVDSQRKRLEA